MATETKAKKPSTPKTKTAAPKAVAAPKVTSAVAERVGLHRREVVGTVVSNKMQKTIVVKVDRRVRHTLYKKYLLKTQRYKAHDEKNEANVGDLVSLVESRPLSRDKRWALQSIVRRAAQGPGVEI